MAPIAGAASVPTAFCLLLRGEAGPQPAIPEPGAGRQASKESSYGAGAFTVRNLLGTSGSARGVAAEKLGAGKQFEHPPFLRREGGEAGRQTFRAGLRGNFP